MANPRDYLVGWICAIRTEHVAARAFLDEEHDIPERVAPGDNNVYTLGRIGKHNIVIASLPDGEYGTSVAATVARDMIHSFSKLRIGLLVGIGGAAPSADDDIRLGDIVVSTAGDGRGGVFQYDFGKVMQTREFETTGFLNQPPPLLRSAVANLRARHEGDGHRLHLVVKELVDQRPRLRPRYQRPDPSTDRLYRSNVVHTSLPNVPCSQFCGDDEAKLVPRSSRKAEEDDPKVHYGLIASGNKLLRDAGVRDLISSKSKALCFEMEAAGLMNHFPCLVIRGICDYADSHKNDDWQGYAAMIAAAYAKELLSRIPPTTVEAETTIAVVLANAGGSQSSTSGTAVTPHSTPGPQLEPSSATSSSSSESTASQPVSPPAPTAPAPAPEPEIVYVREGFWDWVGGLFDDSSDRPGGGGRRGYNAAQRRLTARRRR